jgi:hypothetical protein
MTADTKPTTTDQAPSPSFLKKVEEASDEAVRKLLGIPKKPREERFAKLTQAQLDELHKIEEDAIAEFQGDLNQLEAALGMLRLGHHVGWKVLYLIHSKKTIRTYENILRGKRIRDLFPETGPASYRSFGYQLALKFSNFWKVAGGDIKIPRRKDAAT